MEKSKMIENIKVMLHFGYPCVEEKKRARIKQILSSRLDSGNIKVLKKEIEEMFPEAMERMRKLYGTNDPLTRAMDYWLKGGHNKVLEYEVHHEESRNFCEGYKAKIINHGNNVYQVEYGGKKELVFDELLSNLKIGSEVWIHRGYAVYQ